MAVDLPVGRRRLVAALLILTAVTGLIDAVSYLRMGHVFVAIMTGNIVFLGFSLQPGFGLLLPRRLGSVLAMLVGAATGALLLRITSPTFVIALAAALVVVATTVLLAGVFPGHRLAI